jgi:hypothetical protein
MTETITDFQQLDQLDENQIIAELQGAVTQEMVYSFRSGGKQVTGLSWSGIKHLASRLGNVQVDLLQVLDTGDSWCVLCKALVGESSRVGAAEQSKAMKNGNPDPFALPKATSKAQRNAIRALLPEKLIIETINAHATMPAKVRPAQAQPQPAIAPPPGARQDGNGQRSVKAEFANQLVKELGVSVQEIGAILDLIGGFNPDAFEYQKEFVRFVVTLTRELRPADIADLADTLRRGFVKFDPDRFDEQYQFVVDHFAKDEDEIPF